MTLHKCTDPRLELHCAASEKTALATTTGTVVSTATAV